MACLFMVQVLTLAHQLDPNILRRGVSAGLWDDLRHLLDMLPHAEGEGDPRLGMVTSQRGPSILATDAAVTAVEVRSCPPTPPTHTDTHTPHAHTSSLAYRTREEKTYTKLRDGHFML